MQKVLSILLITSVSLLPNEVLIMTSNKLIWHDNKNVITINHPFASKDSFYYKKFTTTEDTKHGYCKELILDNVKNWRLPTTEELTKLYCFSNKITIK